MKEGECSKFSRGSKKEGKTDINKLQLHILSGISYGIKNNALSILSHDELQTLRALSP